MGRDRPSWLLFMGLLRFNNPAPFVPLSSLLLSKLDSRDTVGEKRKIEKLGQGRAFLF